MKRTAARYLPANPLFSGTDLKRLILPLVIEQILAITVGMADTMMISSVGEAAVSGVSLVDMVNVVIINIFAAMATAAPLSLRSLSVRGGRTRRVLRRDSFCCYARRWRWRSWG